MSVHVLVDVEIERLGRRGEGIAPTEEGVVFIPYALPQDRVTIEKTASNRGIIREILRKNPERQPAICPHFGMCGGCAVQEWPWKAYATWKRDLVVTSLEHIGMKPSSVAPLEDAHGEGRRRVTFHARYQEGRMKVGFMVARSHQIVEIETCPLLAPSLRAALPCARAMVACLSSLRKPVDIVMSATSAGMACELRGSGPLTKIQEQALCALAEEYDLAQISNHGTCLLARRAPLCQMGAAHVHLPAGAFLQATQAGEDLLGARALPYMREFRRIGDFFAGVGTFALRLMDFSEVWAFEQDKNCVKALGQAVHTISHPYPAHIVRRDLFRQPVLASEIEAWGMEAAVIDPPRAGALEQMKAFARSRLSLILSISCAPGTFARDAQILQEGGYVLEKVWPIDQFRHSAHVEMIGVFRKVREKLRSRRRLLG